MARIPHTPTTFLSVPQRDPSPLKSAWSDVDMVSLRAHLHSSSNRPMFVRTRDLYIHTHSIHTGELQHSTSVWTAIHTLLDQTAGQCRHALSFRIWFHLFLSEWLIAAPCLLCKQLLWSGWPFCFSSQQGETVLAGRLLAFLMAYGDKYILYVALAKGKEFQVCSCCECVGRRFALALG